MPASKHISEELDPQVIIDLGYRVVSRKFSTVARIDRPDWRVFLSKALHNPSILNDTSTYSGWPDHYRRCYSKDKFTLHDSINIKLIPNSGHDPVEYVGATHRGWRSLKNEKTRILRAISKL